MTVAVVGAGAFGTSLAIAIARAGRQVTLWGRDEQHVETMSRTRMNKARLDGVSFPKSLSVTHNLGDIGNFEIILLALPAQKIAQFLEPNKALFAHKSIVACCKGIDLKTQLGPTATISNICPTSQPAILTGPSFAIDIANGLPTAVTLACADEKVGREIQSALSTRNLRLYRTTDTTGAEIGGALKNVIAIACGAAMGMGLGESARAALMTRGFAEIVRFATAFGATPITLGGLSGLGDLSLTCSSEKSRNYAFGQSIGKGSEFDSSITVEGAKTAIAVSNIAKTQNIDMPITSSVAKVIIGELSLNDAMGVLLDRPLKEE